MSKNKSVSDEMIVAALMENGTVAKTAKELGITTRTIHQRMKDPDFNLLYRQAKDELVRQAAAAFSGRFLKAVDTVAEIMDNPNVNPQTRLQAAQTVIANTDRFTARLSENESATREKSTNFEEQMLDWLGSALN